MKGTQMKIAAVYIDEFNLNDELFRLSMDVISEERAHKVEKLHFAEDKIRSILGELLVRINLNENWGIENRYIQFEFNEFGKPQLKNHPQLHFNISHSGRWVVAVIDKCPIGLDVEQMKPIDLGIAERFFAPAEKQYILCQPPERSLMGFYQIWTLKESYIKAVGRGLSIPLDSFSFELTKDRIFLSDSISEEEWFFKIYEDLSGYVLAICSAQPNIPDKVYRFSLAELQNKIIQLYDE
jgi:4'-phosphopantetheinyl transferase